MAPDTATSSEPHSKSPSEVEGSLLGRMIQAAMSSAIVGMVTKVYVPVLFPLTFLIGLTAMWMDKLLGFGEGFLPESVKWWVAGASFLLGTFLWLWTYEQLTREGKGSPSPTAGRTTVLVTTGIYAHSRNPSIFGKLLGVLAVGMVMNSFSFCFILIPILLTGSLIEKVWRQEPQLVEIFGEDYLRYQKEVPLFIPWKLFLPRKRQGST